MTAETIDIITKAIAFVGVISALIYLFFTVHGVYTDFAKPIDEHTEKIKELEKRLDRLEKDKEW